jgi:septal ring factor EnvC (AmiA/AmiB activator)
MSLYAHNEALTSEVGDWVDAGDRIATVGASGGRASAALYFELRRNGRPLDPLPWLRRRR